MRALIQRVSAGAVTIEEKETRSIGRGLVVLLGVGPDDVLRDAEFLSEKILNLRLFPSEPPGKSSFDRSVREIHGDILIVSQFTLYADAHKGRRPDFSGAADPEKARGLFRDFISLVNRGALGPGPDEKLKVVSGVFGADMRVQIVNEGPVTLLLDSAQAAAREG